MLKPNQKTRTAKAQAEKPELRNLKLNKKIKGNKKRHGRRAGVKKKYLLGMLTGTQVL